MHSYDGTVLSVLYMREIAIGYCELSYMLLSENVLWNCGCLKTSISAVMDTFCTLFSTGALIQIQMLFVVLHAWCGYRLLLGYLELSYVFLKVVLDTPLGEFHEKSRAPWGRDFFRCTVRARDGLLAFWNGCNVHIL